MRTRCSHTHAVIACTLLDRTEGLMTRIANRLALSLITASALGLGAVRAGAQDEAVAAAQCLPDTTIAVGLPQTVATHQDFARLGFA
jgi:hypothetical protein